LAIVRTKSEETNDQGSGWESYHHPVMTEQKIGDLLANSITHGFGVLLATTGAVWLMIAAARGTLRVIIACAVYALTLVLIYLCSTLYHSLARTRARHVFRVLDHSAIYLLIAGTYTPFTLVSLRGPWGWTLFGIVWGLAVAGVIFKSFAVERFAVASTTAYVLMGWIAIVAILPLARAITWHGILWIGVGGIFYTLGVLFFALDRLRYFHALWHLFILAGSASHYFAVLSYVVPHPATIPVG
jgi:hemolysin III